MFAKKQGQGCIQIYRWPSEIDYDITRFIFIKGAIHKMHYLFSVLPRKGIVFSRDFLKHKWLEGGGHSRNLSAEEQKTVKSIKKEKLES